ncbi:MAG TPA: hypothetical protein VHN37_14940 [Actinomycetota bacterium]|nr:hypothetical protein [Actinomycetota bacterium]
MTRRLSLAVLLAVVAGAVPVDARPAGHSVRATKWFLHIEIDETGPVTGEWTFTLNGRDYPDGGNGSANLSNGVGNEVFHATGAQEPSRNVFVATDGLPLRLAASDPVLHVVTGKIAVRSLDAGQLGVSLPLGAGQAVLELDLSGVPAGSDEPVVIGSQVIEFLVTPFQSRHVLDVLIRPDEALDGVSFTDVALTTHFRGPSVFTGAFELDDPPSFVEVPTVRPRRASP